MIRHSVDALLRSLYRRYIVPPPPPEPIYMAQNPRYAGYDIGEWTYGRPNVLFSDHGGKLSIGKYCSIADGATILLGGEHHLDWVTTYPFSMLWDDAQSFSGYPMNTGNVTIGHDVWIGHEALILSGVSLGNGAVIGARSVVTNDVPPYAVVAGVPARRVKQRFSEEMIEVLQRIAWWNWPVADVRQAWPYLLSGDIDEFVKVHGNVDVSFAPDTAPSMKRSNA